MYIHICVYNLPGVRVGVGNDHLSARLGIRRDWSTHFEFYTTLLLFLLYIRFHKWMSLILICSAYLIHLCRFIPQTCPICVTLILHCRRVRVFLKFVWVSSKPKPLIYLQLRYLFRNRTSSTYEYSIIDVDGYSFASSHGHSLGGTPLYEWSVRRRGLYLKSTQHKRRTCMLPAGFEPAITAMERPQIYALDRTAPRGQLKYTDVDLCLL